MILHDRLFGNSLQSDLELRARSIEAELPGDVEFVEPPMRYYLGRDAAGNSIFADAVEDADGNPLPQGAARAGVRSQAGGSEDPDGLRGAGYFRAQRNQLGARALARRNRLRWRRSQPKERALW